jgi:hypothetical protein
MRKPVLVLVKIALLGLALLAAGLVVYGMRIRGSATALINSAREIRTTADAEREIAAWRNRSGRQFWEESDHPGGDHNYDAQIENVLLSRFRVVEPTELTVGLTMNGGKTKMHHPRDVYRKAA